MKNLKQAYGFVLKNIKKNTKLTSTTKCIKGKTFVIAGGTRGIGFNIGKALVEKGANVAILGKTTEPHPKLENTIDSAVDKLLSYTKNSYEVQKKYESRDIHEYAFSTKAREYLNIREKKRVIGVVCDVRNKESIDEGRDKILEHFGNIDGLVINASALCLNSTLNQTQKEIDLMNGVNIKGSFNVGQSYLNIISKTSTHPHVLVISPPLDMINNSDWWINHFYYSMSKYNMSLMAKFWNEEFPRVSFNTLWPRTTIDTAPVRNLLGGSYMVNISRKPEIMGTAASVILSSDPNEVSGHNFIDDEVCVSADIDVEQFRVNKEVKEKDLMPDFFC